MFFCDMIIMVNNMKSTFLQDIGKFIKDGNLFRGSNDRVYISNHFLPSSFRRAILERALKFNNFASFDDSFVLLFDRNKNHLCMLFSFSGGKTNILVKDTDEHIFIDEKYTPVNLDDIIIDAAKKDVRSDLYEAAVDSLKTHYSYPDFDARREAAYKVDMILQDFNDEDYIAGSKINETLDNIKPIIEEYATYISEIYRTSVENNNSDVVVLPSIIPLIANIIYKQGKSHRSNMDTTARIEAVYNHQRINEVIDCDKRKKVLDGLGPIATGSALNITDDEIDYYIYLYRVGENEYKFIFEPLSGKKCTKMFCFKFDEELNASVIEKMARTYLSMSEDEVIECNYAIRLNHTSEETYNNVIPYAITMNSNKYACPYGTKSRIDSLLFDESELEKGKTL